MKIATIRDLHMRTSALVREAAGGAVIVIGRHGEPIAELRPVAKKPSKRRLSDMADLWRRFPAVAADCGRFLEEAR